MTWRRAIPVVGAVALIAYAVIAGTAPLYLSPAALSLLFLTLYYVCLAGAWNFFSGFSGYINFGFVLFVGLGMYGSVIGFVDYKMGLIPGYLTGGLVSALVAAVIGYPLLRIRGAYFAISMLALAEGARVLISTKYLTPFTRGGAGMPVLAGTLTQKYYAIFLLAVCIVLATMFFARSYFGLSLIAVREDESAASGLAVNTTAVKVSVFVVSAFFAGTAGGIQATFLHYIEPFAAFDIKYTMLSIVMAMFGGLGTVLGAVIGAVTLQLISDYVWLHLGQANITVFGLVMVCLVIWMPDGVLVRLKEMGILPKTRWI